MPSHRPVQALCETLKRRWGSGLGTEIASLVTSCLALFRLTKDLKVEHEQLVGALQKWLDEHPIPPEGRNSCPFKDKDGKQAI
ncbi:hypothetical protein HYDPIDRAFT_118521 [Hydnomerulius pinastri MD-312]|uniref:Uncharacterized protein n=1 Tax=Hydnomerulius pinastri MD-312 TaxID=994086 RepID=A0A0C9W8N4_9AGAM|nr:hypothetical protein HYDPIDRAFT_118521 [Hydnomerulius pinastri MD-312]